MKRLNRKQTEKIVKAILADLMDQRFKSYMECWDLSSAMQEKSTDEIRQDVLHSVWHWLHFVGLKLADHYKMTHLREGK